MAGFFCIDGKRLRPGFTLLAMSMLIVLVGSAFASFSGSNLPVPLRVRANAETPPGPDRYASILVDYTIYTWWMALFEDSSLACEIVIDHEGLPTLNDVFTECGEDIHDEWFTQDLQREKLKIVMGTTFTW